MGTGVGVGVVVGLGIDVGVKVGERAIVGVCAIGVDGGGSVVAWVHAVVINVSVRQIMTTRFVKIRFILSSVFSKSLSYMKTGSGLTAGVSGGSPRTDFLNGTRFSSGQNPF